MDNWKIQNPAIWKGSIFWLGSLGDLKLSGLFITFDQGKRDTK